MALTLNKDHITPIGLGCMGMSEFYGKSDDNESLKTLNHAFKLGCQHFDTADMYGFGHNEKLLGQFIQSLAQDRENIFLTSKVGIVRDENNKYSISVNSTKAYIKRSCEESLKRLKTDYIDLYYLHRRDPDVPLEESMEALSELESEGKIRNIGLCEVSADALKEANDIHPISAVQSEYSLWSRDLEAEIIPLCEQLDIAIVAFSPLGRGFLTGHITKDDIKNADPELDFRTKLPRFSEEYIDLNLQLVVELKQISESLDITPAQLALAWVLSKSKNINVIPGTRRVKYLEENFSAKDIQLPNDVISNLNNLFSPDNVHGDRYPKAILARSNQ